MPTQLENKTAGVIETLRKCAARFGRNDDDESRAASLNVRETRTYGIERAVLRSLAERRPDACGPSIRAALAAPQSKWSEPLLSEVIGLADAIDGKPVVVVAPAATVEPVTIPAPEDVE